MICVTVLCIMDDGHNICKEIIHISRIGNIASSLSGNEKFFPKFFILFKPNRRSISHRDNYGIEPDGNPIGQLLYFDQLSAGWLLW